ncbi:MAG: ATP-dependent RNA helicase HrpA [Propionibacteriaceae bacterium]
MTLAPDLPVTAFADDIAEAIRTHPVVVVAGETGSGKTTQLPKICLQLGRRSIGHTQPRRIAARTVAERIAEELATPLGELVGYQVRFTRKAGRATRLKVMTDGVLLAEIGHDRDLRRYDTIIVDEAHERSLNIDFLLGYLKQLLGRRDDLKIIITSATIDTARFAEHFGGPDGPAPVIEVSGRTYPVEVRYRPLDDQDGVDQVDGITTAIKELRAEKDGVGGNGDILVFLSGEREIRDAAEAVEALRLPATEVLPLYARLSAAEQHKVFRTHANRRVVLATNVAETSVTVPGIRYVIDTGLARISRYSARTKVQRLPIEPIAQASANQRAGRCGRLGPGICIRLYAEEDFEARPEFTEPEILRTNLASVILQMAAADLGDIAGFPFVEPPDRARVTDGLKLLEELGAITTDRAADHGRADHGRADHGRADRGRADHGRRGPRLTGVGRRLAAIPLDPRMGRMLLAAERQGALAEALVIVAGLSIPDPRERPPDAADKADAAHRRFWAPLLDAGATDPAPGAPGTAKDDRPTPDGSDFVTLLRLWDYLQEQQRSLSGNAFRRLCRSEYLHFLRIREWQDLHAQLRQIAKDLGLQANVEPASTDRVHTAVLTGLLSHVGLAEVRAEKREPGRKRGRSGPREYLGARGTKFAINPGSSLARTPPPLVMAAEVVETTRLWARTVAGIDARQVEEVGAHLLKRTYSEPHWSARAAAVLAYETVTLYGVPIVARRPTPYAKVDPEAAREIFLRSALVEQDWRTRHAFFAANAELRERAATLEDRTRRRDMVVDDQVIFDFYAARVPADVVSGAHFDRWWRDARGVDPDQLTLTLEDLLVGEVADADAFPDHWTLRAPGTGSGGRDLAGREPVELPVHYTFDPGSDRDGVTVTVPLALLNQLDPAAFSWQVPGLRAELVTELIRSLPKALRTRFVPAPEFARRALRWLVEHPVDRDQVALADALASALVGLSGEAVTVADLRPAEVPAHLRPTFVVTDGGAELGHGKDLEDLRRRLQPRLVAALNSAGSTLRRTGLTGWDIAELPAEVERGRGSGAVVGYPALVDEGASVGVLVLDSAERARRSQRTGLRRLVTLAIPDPTRWVVAHLGNTDKLALGASPYASVPELLTDARLASAGELVRRTAGDGWEVRDAGAFQALCDRVRADHAEFTRDLVRLVAQVLAGWQDVQRGLPAVRAVAPDAADDLREQLATLVFPGFVAATPYAHLVDLPRYLQAAHARVRTLTTDPRRDAQPAASIARVEDRYAVLCDAVPPGPLPEALAEAGWLLEELRVSLFAQSLRTKVPVSEKRVLAALDQAARP